MTKIIIAAALIWCVLDSAVIPWRAPGPLCVSRCLYLYQPSGSFPSVILLASHAVAAAWSSFTGDSSGCKPSCTRQQVPPRPRAHRVLFRGGCHGNRPAREQRDVERIGYVSAWLHRSPNLRMLVTEKRPQVSADWTVLLLITGGRNASPPRHDGFHMWREI